MLTTPRIDVIYIDAKATNAKGLKALLHEKLKLAKCFQNNTMIFLDLKTECKFHKNDPCLFKLLIKQNEELGLYHLDRCFCCDIKMSIRPNANHSGLSYVNIQLERRKQKNCRHRIIDYEQYVRSTGNSVCPVLFEENLLKSESSSFSSSSSDSFYDVKSNLTGNSTETNFINNIV